METWIEEALKNTDLGDKRLNKRYRVVLEQLSSKPTLSIPAACGGWADIQAAYRFFDNPKVTPTKLLAPHRALTVQRCAEQAVVLVGQDTTELDVTRPREKVGGPLGDEKHWGVHVHPSLVMTPAQIPLGILDATMWARALEGFHKRAQARNKPIEEKESYRWLQGYEQACELQRQVTSQVVSLADSEGDIYEIVAAWADTSKGRNADFIVRGCQNRRLASSDPADAATRTLWEAVSATPVRGRRAIEVSVRPALTGDGSRRRQARSARTATVTLQATTVTLQGPWRAEGKKLPNVTVNVVLVREENPPVGEPAIEWLLVTSLPVTTLVEIETVVDYYCCRWLIEVYFHVLKSGCEVEKLQLETTERFLACVAVYLIVAWRVLYVVRLGRECPDMSCQTVFLPEEWQSVWRVVKGKEPPKKPPRLQDIVELIAQLGGYIRRPHEPPGPKTLWIGLQRMRDFALVWSLFRPSPPLLV